MDLSAGEAATSSGRSDALLESKFKQPIHGQHAESPFLICNIVAGDSLVCSSSLLASTPPILPTYECQSTDVLRPHRLSLVLICKHAFSPRFDD